MLNDETSLGLEKERSTAIALRAGPLELLFEPRSAWVRQVRFGGREVVRAIYGAVRDRNWATVLPVVKDLAVAEKKSGGFEIQFTAVCRQRSIHFVWRGRITGNATGEIRFEFDGEARCDFLRNRIGLCLLYPIAGCSGRQCVVEHSDGSSEPTAFPKLISPFQPFMDIQTVRQKLTPGATLEIGFEGETFEMEDQRNWTDASFKIYSTPLALPFPAQVRKGQTVRQAVTLRLIRTDEVRPTPRRRSVDGSTGSTPAEVTVNFDRVRPRSLLGLGLPGEDVSLSPAAIERLAKLKLDHVRVDCRLWERDWTRRVKQACKQAKSLGTGLHVAVFLEEKDGSELRRLGQLTFALRAPVRLWLVFHRSEVSTPAWCIKEAREALAPVSRLAKFAAGTDANFAELNRHRPVRNPDWLPCCSMNPQVHASDNLSMIENIAGQGDVVKAARAFSRQPLVISPITLLPRISPAATEAGVRRKSGPADPRQTSLFAAGWTVGSLAELREAHPVHSITYYETVGPRGIMEAHSGRVFPVYHVFAGVVEMTKLAERRFANARTALQVAVLAGVKENDQAIIWLANLTNEPIEVRLKTNPRFRKALMKSLHEANAGEASCFPENWWRGTLPCSLGIGTAPLKLSPHALARLELR